MSKLVDDPEIVRLALIVRKLERAYPSVPADGEWHEVIHMDQLREIQVARRELDAALDSRL